MDYSLFMFLLGKRIESSRVVVCSTCGREWMFDKKIPLKDCWCAACGIGDDSIE